MRIHVTGTSRVAITQPGVTSPAVGQSTCIHTFLRLLQPIYDDEYPQPRILEAGRKYKFPFTFVVPERLLPDSCKHAVNHSQVTASHTQLPPSLGDPMVAGHRRSLLDDMAPDMVRIQYAIRAKLLKHSPLDETKMRTVTEKALRLRIIPASEENPPLNVTDDSEEYCMRKEKEVKRGPLRSGNVGRLTVVAAQPRPFKLQRVQRSGNEAAESDEDVSSTATTLRVRFDPADEKQQPPRLGRLWTKLRATTWYGLKPWADFPSKAPAERWNAEHGSYVHNVPLAERCVASATWQKHTAGAATSSRRSSIQSGSSLDSESTSSSTTSVGRTYYTTSILVPLTLPKTKAIVPTFHSCLASRTYAIEMALNYRVHGSASFTAPHINVRIPVQVMGPGVLSDPSQILIRSAELADEALTPRTIRAPLQEYTERATILRGADAVRDSAASQPAGSTTASAANSTATRSRAYSGAAPPGYSAFGRPASGQRIVQLRC
jgi:hypothetical protein